MLDVAIAAALVAAGLCIVATPSSAYDKHAIILIDSNLGFTASNGVTSGTGTADDPFIIEGWSITERTPTDESYANYPIAIEIAHTDSYLIIRNLEILSATDGSGIVIFDSENIEIDSVTIESGSISFYSCSNVNVHDCDLSTGSIDATSSSDISLVDNVIRTDGWYSVYLDDCEGFVVSGNGISGDGIYFENVTHTSIEDNTLEGEDAGFSAIAFNSLVVSGNTFSDKGISLMAFSAQDYETSTITEDNYLAGQRIPVYRNAYGVSLQGSQISQVILIDCYDVQITGADFVNRTTAIVAAGTRNIRISDTNITGSEYGAFFCDCTDVIIENSIVSSSVKDGVFMWSVDRVTVTGNLFQDNGDYLGGMSVQDPIQGWIGIPTGYGVYFRYSSNITVYHNDFFENIAHLQMNNCTNVRLDAGYELGGNYWSGYSDHDLMAGEDQSVPSPDGIWDRPYELFWNTGAKDSYPSIAPFRNLTPTEVPTTPQEENPLVGSLCISIVIVVIVVIVVAFGIGRLAKRRLPK